MAQNKRPWWIALIVLAGWGLMVMRRPDSVAGLYLWAEDGAVFLQQAHLGDLTLLGQPYAGQSWLLMRLAAAPIALLPAQWWPLATYLVACLIATLAVGVVLQQRAGGILGPLPLRIVLFFVLIAQPLVWEVQGNLANAHVWVALGLLVILVLPAPRSIGGKVLEIGFVVLGCLTGLLGLLLLPAAIWGLIRERNPYGILRVVVVAAAAVTNVALQWTARLPGSAGLDDYGASGAVFVVKRFAGGLLLGEKGQLAYWNDAFLSPLLVPALAILAGLAFLIVRDIKGPSPIWVFSGFLWLGLGLTAVVGRSIAELFDPFAHGRYLVFAVGATILVIFRALALPDRTGRVVGALMLAAMALSVVTGFVMATEPDVPFTTLDRSQLENFGLCVEQETYPCVLPIAPEGWAVVIANSP